MEFDSALLADIADLVKLRDKKVEEYPVGQSGQAGIFPCNPDKTANPS
jgi:hypothetical protein